MQTWFGHRDLGMGELLCETVIPRQIIGLPRDWTPTETTALSLGWLSKRHRVTQATLKATGAYPASGRVPPCYDLIANALKVHFFILSRSAKGICKKAMRQIEREKQCYGISRLNINSNTSSKPASCLTQLAAIVADKPQFDQFPHDEENYAANSHQYVSVRNLAEHQNRNIKKGFEMPFLSVVFIFRNQSKIIESVLSDVANVITGLVSDYELIIVDNASEDDSLSIIKKLTGEDGFANLQAYALTKEVDTDTASWVGLENALGDFVAVIDPLVDDLNFLPEMLDKAVRGSDVVFAKNEQKPPQSLAYRGAYSLFHGLYNFFNGVHLAKEAPQYRILSKRVINFILQHPQPAMTYRHLPATGGFPRSYLTYSAKPKATRPKRLGESVDRGMRLLVSTTRAPMRLVTTLSLFGAIANLIYSIYVVAVGLFKADVAPGWISFSLQQSGMFFLISLVLLVLGEYILNMASLSNEGPLYHVGQEFTSARMTRREKLNVESVTPASTVTHTDRAS